MRITSFRPDDSRAIEAWTRLANAANAVDAPWEHELTGVYAEGFLTHGWDGEPATPYLCTVDGEVVATAELWASRRDNLHRAAIEVTVHPAHRRRGHGSDVLAFLTEEVRRLGRSTVAAEAWESEAQRGFAAHHGYAEVSRAVNRRQAPAQVDPAVLAHLVAEALPHADGYLLERWPTPTPDEDLAALAELTAAINDAPTDDMDHEDEVFDAARIRAYETATAGRGERMHRLVARHAATGELAGQTVVCVELERPHLAHQHDTSVVHAHRGHRLGLLLKAEMLRWLAEAEPQVAEVETWNAESNHRMIGVNELLGYRPVGRTLVFERRI